jgi:hypothetical protein
MKYIVKCTDKLNKQELYLQIIDDGLANYYSYTPNIKDCVTLSFKNNKEKERFVKETRIMIEDVYDFELIEVK